MKIFITGSTTGLGEIAGEKLLKAGHEVLFHARSKSSQLKSDRQYVFGDLSHKEEIASLAEQVNAHGPFDSIIHNAGLYQAPAKDLFIVNVLAPYMLTTLIQKPQRLIYLSSGMHLGGHVNLKEIENLNYSDSKLYVLMLTKYFARKWSDCFVNAVDPGWVPTRMGGSNAPDDLQKGAETQAWLAVSNDSSALVSGEYFHHMKIHQSNPQAESVQDQDELVNNLRCH